MRTEKSVDAAAHQQQHSESGEKTGVQTMACETAIERRPQPTVRQILIPGAGGPPALHRHSVPLRVSLDSKGTATRPNRGQTTAREGAPPNGVSQPGCGGQRTHPGRLPSPGRRQGRWPRHLPSSAGSPPQHLPDLGGRQGQAPPRRQSLPASCAGGPWSRLPLLRPCRLLRSRPVAIYLPAV